jgi:hypothetical protein
MADKDALKRLTSYKNILARDGQNRRDRSTSFAEVFAEHVLGCDPRALKKAAQSVGLDHTHAPHLSILVRILAHELFRPRGKKKGDGVWWNDRRSHALISKAREIKSRNPKLSDEKIAEQIAEEDPKFKRFREDSEPLRKRLSRFRQHERLLRDAGVD